MFFSTPSHARAHLRSLNILLTALQNSIVALLRSLTSGIASWRKQNLVVIDLLKGFGLIRFRYPSSIPARLSTSLHPGFAATLRNLYFSESQLFTFLEEELANPISKVIKKIKTLLEEFEYCYSLAHNEEQNMPKAASSVSSQEKSSASALQPSFSFAPSDSREPRKPGPSGTNAHLKERRQRIVARIQKLDGQINSWLRHYVKEVFGVLSFLFACAAYQFDGREMSEDEVAMTDRVTCFLQSTSHRLPNEGKLPPLIRPTERNLKVEGGVGVRVSHEVKSSWSTEDSAQDCGSFKPLVSNDTLGGALEEQFTLSSQQRISPKVKLPIGFPKGSLGLSLEGPSNSVTLSASSCSSGVAITGAGDLSGAVPSLPSCSQPNPLAFSGIPQFQELDTSSGDFCRWNQRNITPPSPPISSKVSGRISVLSSRECVLKSMDRELLIKDLEGLVQQGRVLFDNTISLAFSFSRSLGKLMDVILHEDDRARQFRKLVQGALFSLEQFVYLDYSELQAMLPLIFIKIMCQIDEREDRKYGVGGVVQRAKKFISGGHLSNFAGVAKNRPTAFPVRHVGSHSKQKKKQEPRNWNEWLHFLGAPQSDSRKTHYSQNSASSSSMKIAWLDCFIQYNSELSNNVASKELAPRHLTAAVLDKKFIEQERERLLQQEISLRSGAVQENSMSPTQQTLSSHAVQLTEGEIQKERLRKNLTAYNVFVRNSFRKLSMVYVA